jgi:hypothetical protein
MTLAKCDLALRLVLEVPYGDLPSVFLVPPTPSCVGLRCHTTHLTLPSLPAPSLCHPYLRPYPIPGTPHMAWLSRPTAPLS